MNVLRVVTIGIVAFGAAGVAGMGVLTALGTGLLGQAVGALSAIVTLLVWLTHPAIRRAMRASIRHES